MYARSGEELYLSVLEARALVGIRILCFWIRYLPKTPRRPSTPVGSDYASFRAEQRNLRRKPEQFPKTVQKGSKGFAETLGPLVKPALLVGFQDQSHKPLDHLSRGVSA